MSSKQLEITEQDEKLVLQPQTAPTVPQPTPMLLLQIAMNQGADIGKLEKLMDLQERWQKQNAEVAYNDAMSKAQEEMRRVATDLTNPQTHSNYASYAAIDRAIRPIYTKHGFSLSFDTADSTKPEHIKVLCKVAHRGGHSEVKQVDMPADGKGAKGGDVMTKTHAAGSAMTYGQRYLVKLIFNIAVGADDDGNAAGEGMADLNDHLEYIANARNMDELKKLYQQAHKLAQTAKDMKATTAIINATNTKKRELGGK